MFWKALIVALALSLYGSWTAFKIRNRSKGIPMRQDRDGIYRPYDWPKIWERRAQRAFWFAFTLFALWAVFATIILLTGFQP